MSAVRMSLHQPIGTSRAFFLPTRVICGWRDPKRAGERGLLIGVPDEPRKSEEEEKSHQKKEFWRWFYFVVLLTRSQEKKRALGIRVVDIADLVECIAPLAVLEEDITSCRPAARRPVKELLHVGHTKMIAQDLVAGRLAPLWAGGVKPDARALVAHKDDVVVGHHVKCAIIVSADWTFHRGGGHVRRQAA